MIRPIAILLATSVAACAADERSQPHWPETLAPVVKPAKKPEVRGWVRHTPARTIVKREVVSKPEPIAHRCKPVVVATGDFAKSEEAAKLEAQKGWKGAVQMDYGNLYMDLRHAEDITYQCGPSSVPRYGGTVEATVSKFLPIESVTCKIRAQPCASPVQRDDGK